MQKGIEYKLTGEARRGQVASYHGKPSPRNHSTGAKSCDIAGLKKVQRGNFIESFGDFRSKFTIGFEVEKNSLHRGSVKEYELFCGFEHDGSCGYEAVTHILPLLPSSTWKTKVFDMMHKATKIIDDQFSPSDNRCGGHITIASDGLSGDELRELIRKNSGIILALFRKRLSNKFCGANRRMQSSSERKFNSETAYINESSWTDYSKPYNSNGWHGKYQTALVKNNCLEFRLPSRFQSVKQMMRRYELMYELVDYSINKPNGSFNTFLKSVRPIILSMYNGDNAKTDEVLDLAKDFQSFINNGKISSKIERYLK